MNVVSRLNAIKATPETILQILKSSVFEASGDMSPAEMRSALEGASKNQEVIVQALRELESKPDLVRDIALMWIMHSSNQEESRHIVEGAISGADRDMPLLEVGTIALVALYAIYMLGPEKPKTIKKTIKLMPDGTFELQEETTYDTFSTPIKGLLGLLFKSGKQD